MVQTQAPPASIHVIHIRRGHKLEAIGKRADAKSVVLCWVGHLLANGGSNRAMVSITQAIAITVGVA